MESEILNLARISRHAARTPVRRIRWDTLQRPDNHGLDVGVVNRPWRADPGLISQSIHAMLDKTPAPLADGGLSIRGSAATCLFCFPVAQRSTIRARKASACAVLRRAASDSRADGVPSLLGMAARLMCPDRMSKYRPPNLSELCGLSVA